MSCLGVHFSLDEQIVNKLRSYKRESARLKKDNRYILFTADQ